MADLTPTLAVRLGMHRRASRGPLVLVALSYCWLPIVLIAAWWVLSAGSTNPYVPSFQAILDVLIRDLGDGTLAVAAGWTLLNLSLGLAFAVVVGVSVGVLLGEWEAAREVIGPIVDFARSVPQVALVPLIIGALGIGIWPKVLIIAIACLWPIMLNTIDGVRGVEPVARSMSKIYRIPRVLHFRRVVLPAAAPQILAGVRVSLGIGVAVMVVAELFGSDRGLGYYILNSAQTFQFPKAWAGALLVGVIGYLLTLVFAIFERSTLRWYFSSGAK